MATVTQESMFPPGTVMADGTPFVLPVKPKHKIHGGLIAAHFTDQGMCIRALLDIFNEGRMVECDPTFSEGKFWRQAGRGFPKHCFDIDPPTHEVGTLIHDFVKQADCRAIPLDDESIMSALADPPFVIGSQGKGKSGIQKSRFSFYKSVEELESVYTGLVSEFWRILQPGGVCFIKLQNVVNSGKKVWSRDIVTAFAESVGFVKRDEAVLINPGLPENASQMRQLHLRCKHSYFVVLVKPGGSS